eukprot:XP_011669360.1 PREDICTED: PAS domain-containing serine/threonine-protein kinase isoform X2 [Strongylocentrotus purpuratus]
MLYTLVFGENPFYDVEETIEAILKPPFAVSTTLMQLVSWLLHPEPEFRCTLTQLHGSGWLQQPMDISIYKWNEVMPPEDKGVGLANFDPSPPPSEREEWSDGDEDEALAKLCRREYERQLSLTA